MFGGLFITIKPSDKRCECDHDSKTEIRYTSRTSERVNVRYQEYDDSDYRSYEKEYREPVRREKRESYQQQKNEGFTLWQMFMSALIGFLLLAIISVWIEQNGQSKKMEGKLEEKEKMENYWKGKDTKPAFYIKPQQ